MNCMIEIFWLVHVLRGVLSELMGALNNSHIKILIEHDSSLQNQLVE